MHEKLKKGDFIGREYEVFDLLGEGGFGTVYQVYSHSTKEVYAFKTCRDEYIEDTIIRGRFRKEAQVWIDLERHPYIVRAKFVASITGRLYIAMEHIASDEPGMNALEGFLRNRPPDLEQSLRWAIQFCHGMEHAYSRGIKAHRDIKPANIMIDQNMAVKITDFGLANIYSENSDSEQYSAPEKVVNDVSMQTAIGTSIGTPEYMSPEQFEDLTACDERSDIYSFGIVLFCMASGGNLPFKADNPAYRWATLKHFHLNSNIPQLISAIFPIIQRCLEKKPANRYQAFKELRADLEPLFKQKTGEMVKLPELKELDAWELANKGFSFSSLGKELEAITCYDKALEINPRYVSAWYNKGFSFASLGRELEAIACYDKALEIDPRYVAAWHNKGAVFEKLGKTQEAIACYDKALEIDPRDASEWFGKGAILGSLGKTLEAIACYDKALEIDPVHAMAWGNKGVELGKNGKEQEAIACFDKSLEIDPINAATWHNKGVALGRLGKDREAIVCYDRALDIDSTDAVAWHNKGVAEDKLNKKQAVISYKNFLKLAPNHDVAATILKRIEALENRYWWLLGKDIKAIAHRIATFCKVGRFSCK